MFKGRFRISQAKLSNRKMKAAKEKSEIKHSWAAMSSTISKPPALKCSKN